MHRSVCIFGAVISCLGLMLSVFSSNVYILIFTFGIVGGFGQGLLYTPACIVPGLWFDKNRALATGVLSIYCFIYFIILVQVLLHVDQG